MHVNVFPFNFKHDEAHHDAEDIGLSSEPRFLVDIAEGVESGVGVIAESIKQRKDKMSIHKLLL